MRFWRMRNCCQTNIVKRVKANVSDDELISTYVDGRLSEHERVAFEARLRVEAGLRRRVMATQLLAREARQISAVPAPRNFILSRDIGAARAPAQACAPSLFPVSLFRLGSVTAALLFVFFVGLDVMQSSSRTARVVPAAAPMVASLAPTVVEVTEATVQAVEATQDLLAPAPVERSAALVTVMPMATLELPTEATTAVLSEAVTQASAASAMSADAERANGADAAQAAQPADALALTATPQPKLEAAPTPSQPQPTFAAPPSVASPIVESTPEATNPILTAPRVLAVIAFLFAIALGIPGWTRR